MIKAPPLLLLCALAAAKPIPRIPETFCVRSVEAAAGSSPDLTQTICIDRDNRKRLMVADGDLVNGHLEELTICGTPGFYLQVAGTGAATQCANTSLPSPTTGLCDFHSPFWAFPGNASYAGVDATVRAADGAACDHWRYWQEHEEYGLWLAPSAPVPVRLAKTFTAVPGYTLWHIDWLNFTAGVPPAARFALPHDLPPCNAAVAKPRHSRWPAAPALFNQVAMVMSHDAATGYLQNSTWDPVLRYAKTQSVGFGGQLSCGSRAFDIRPAVEGGNLLMHHGGVIVHVDLAFAVAEVVSWLAANQTEMAVLYVTDCQGANCAALAQKVMTDAGIPVVSDCTQLAGLTVAAARNLAQLKTGGHALAIFGCVDEQYDPSIMCYLDQGGKTYVCYDEATASLPFQQFWNYMNTTTAKPMHTGDGLLWMAQGHWQSNVDSIAAGVLHGSDILLDEQRAGVNARLVSAVATGQLPYLNLLEVDNVCDNGLALLAALEARNQRLGLT